MTLLQRIKGKIYAFVFWKTNLGDLVNKVYDLKIFYKYAFTEKKLRNRSSFEAFLTKQYHIVEKGLALPNSRPGFGKPKITLLILKTKQYQERFGEDRIVINIKQTLKQYLDRNKLLKEKDYEYHELIFDLVSGMDFQEKGGVKKISKSDINNYTNIDFSKFIKSRTSVRNFSDSDVLHDEVFKAVDLARFAPSVCNRQSWKVHYYKDKKIKNSLLKLQGGNGGFTDSINQLLIVTSEVSRFTKLESNQVYVDGGLFAMNLLLGLHSQNIASCCLNTCFPYIVEKEVKKLAKIPESERLIMMIGIGNFKENFEVAISNRIDVKQILTFHDNNYDKAEY
jgi:nitroreductase